MDLKKPLFVKDDFWVCSHITNTYNSKEDKYDSLEILYNNPELKTSYSKFMCSLEGHLDMLKEFKVFLESDTIPTNRTLRWADENLKHLLKEYNSFRNLCEKSISSFSIMCKDGIDFKDA